jgi:hypothetical protein
MKRWRDTINGNGWKNNKIPAERIDKKSQRGEEPKKEPK